MRGQRPRRKPHINTKRERRRRSPATDHSADAAARRVATLACSSAAPAASAWPLSSTFHPPQPSKVTIRLWKARSAGRCAMDRSVMPAAWHARYSVTSPSALTCQKGGEVWGEAPAARRVAGTCAVRCALNLDAPATRPPHPNTRKPVSRAHAPAPRAAVAAQSGWASRRTHRTGALVQDRVAWVVEQQARHGQALLFATRQRVGPVLLLGPAARPVAGGQAVVFVWAE